MRDFIGLIIFVVFIVGLLAGAVAVEQYKYNPWRCDNLSEMTGRNVQYIHFDGCYVEVNGEMVPKERFVSIQQEQEK